MHRTLAFIVTLLSIEGSLVACKDRPPPPRPSPVDEPTKPARLTSGPDPGSIGHNGLAPITYHTHKMELEKRMNDALTSPPPAGNLHAAFDSILGIPPAPSDVETLVDYAISCAVSKSSVATYKGSGYSADNTYISPNTNSLLTTTKGWTNASLDPAPPGLRPWEDLHACLATRLNPSTNPVTILLSGAHVKTDGLDHSAFGIDEAYWAVNDPHPGNGPVIHVWPLDTVTNVCPHSPDDPNKIPAVNTRVCGTFTGYCGLEVRLDSAACAPNATGWQCPRSKGCNCNDLSTCVGPDACVEVIKTRIKCEDWCTFYPDCPPPAGCTAVCPKGSDPPGGE